MTLVDERAPAVGPEAPPRYEAPQGYRPFDMWLALLAGERVWNDDDDRPRTQATSAAAGFMIVGLLMTVVVQWVTIADEAPFVNAVRGELAGRDREHFYLLLASLLAAVALISRPIRIILGRTGGSARYVPSLIWRGAAYATLIGTTCAVLPRVRFVAAIPLGIVGGADAILTLWALGVTVTAAGWLRRFTFSTLHYGVLGAMLAASITRSDGRFFRIVVELYAAMWIGVIVSCVTVVWIDHLRRLLDRDLAVQAASIRAGERSQRAHWLHDDVLSEVQLTRLRIKNASDVDAAQAELSELDHRLRLRQLDELMRGGSPHVYEVLQPHIRRAQGLGVVFDRVPPLEVTEQRLDEPSARMLHRVVSGLVSNALNAGATRMAIDLEATPPGHLRVSVSDDACGFELDDVPAGRGLSLLMAELGPSALTRTDNVEGGGSVVSVTLPITDAGVRSPTTKEPA